MKKSHRQSMPFERGSSHPALLLLVAVGVANATAAVIVKADVLYDSTAMTDDQTYNHTYTSSITLWNGGWDRQAADDFEIDATYLITSVTGDFTNTPPPVSPAEGFLVEFFSNETEKCVNGPPPCPSEIPFAQAFSTSFAETPFEDTVFGNSGHRFTIDLSDSEITLGPGTWWISVVAVDESGEKSSSETWAIVITDGLPRGVPVHGRAGGQDHGNGYQGGDLPDWIAQTFGGDEATPGDAAIRIEGTLVKPACPWDMDGCGIVGASDLLSLLASWGPCKGCPADFDGNGNVGASDLLALLANWGLCP